MTGALLPTQHPSVRIPPSKGMSGTSMHRPRWAFLFCTAALCAPLAMAFLPTQEPAPPYSLARQSPAPASSKPSKKRYSHANDFLIRGTVFNDKALSLPGVQLRIRRAGEKKFHWEQYTNSRGEFAVRVPQGSEYEVVVRVKGFAEQTRAIDAKNGEIQDNVVFRMQPAERGKNK